MRRTLVFLCFVVALISAYVMPALAEGELPSLPDFAGGTALIAAGGTAILLLAVGIVIFRRLKSVVR